jgi:hypothetical protein
MYIAPDGLAKQEVYLQEMKGYTRAAHLVMGNNSVFHDLI